MEGEELEGGYLEHVLAQSGKHYRVLDKATRFQRYHQQRGESVWQLQMPANLD